MEKEIKLKEFNFKMLHGILSCNTNLFKWKIKLNEKCDICEYPQSIKHLLFECECVKPLWNSFNNIFGLNVSFRQLLGLDKNFRTNDLTTVICFIIYKQWLLASLNNKLRSTPLPLSYFKEELGIRIRIYKLCKSIDCNRIDKMVKFMNSL